MNRVDVSLDGGDHFTRAELIQKPIIEHRQSQWSWQFFEKEIPIPKELKKKLRACFPKKNDLFWLSLSLSLPIKYIYITRQIFTYI